MISCPSFMPPADPADPDNDICEKTGSARSGKINRKRVLGTKRRQNGGRGRLFKEGIIIASFSLI